MAMTSFDIQVEASSRVDDAEHFDVIDVFAIDAPQIDDAGKHLTSHCVFLIGRCSPGTPF